MITKCRIPGKEFICDLLIQKDSVKAIDYKSSKEVVSINLHDILTTDISGKEFTLVTSQGDRLTFIITAELTNKARHILRFIEMKEEGKEALEELFKHSLTYTEIVSDVISILKILQRNNIPNWSKIEVLGDRISERLKLCAETGVIMTSPVNFLSNIKKKHVEGIRMSSKSVIRESYRDIKQNFGRRFRSADFSPLADIVLFLHSYTLAKELGYQLESEKIVKEYISTIEEFHFKLFPLGEESARALTMWAKEAITKEGDAKELITKYLEKLGEALTSFYHL